MLNDTLVMLNDLDSEVQDAYFDPSKLESYVWQARLYIGQLRKRLGEQAEKEYPPNRGLKRLYEDRPRGTITEQP